MLFTNDNYKQKRIMMKMIIIIITTTTTTIIILLIIIIVQKIVNHNAYINSVMTTIAFSNAVIVTMIMIPQ